MNTNDYNKNNYFGYTLASAGERLIAEIITAFVSFCIFAICVAPFYIIVENIENESSSSIVPMFAFFILSACTGIALAIAFRFLLYPRYCGTFGHKVLRLKVVSAEDGSDYKKRSGGFIREVLKSIFWQFLIPVMWLLWDKDKQNLYDKVTKTFVVKVNK